MDDEEILESSWDESQMDEDENLHFNSSKNREGNDIKICDESFRRFLSGWEKQRCMVVVQLVCY